MATRPTPYASNLTARLRDRSRLCAAASGAAEAPLCVTCGVSLHSGTHLGGEVAMGQLRINLGPTCTAMRSVRWDCGCVWVNSDLNYVEHDLVRTVHIEEDDAWTMVNWLRNRPGWDVSAQHLQRVGFRDCDGDEAERESPCEAKRIVFSDGCATLKRGFYYASSVHCGGEETFWPFEFHTAKFKTADAAMISEASDIESDCDGSISPRVVLTKWSSKRMMERLDEHCVRNPGIVVQVNFPGARECAPSLEPHRVYAAPTFCRDAGGQCTRAALLNAVHACCGLEAVHVVRRRGRAMVRSLAALQYWLEFCIGWIHLERLAAPDVNDVDHWLEERRGGSDVYIMRLVGEDRESFRVDHCVAIDCARGLVIDSCEDVCLDQRAGVLNGCVGDHARLLRIEEVRRLVVQSMAKKSRKRRRNPHERELKKRKMLMTK